MKKRVLLVDESLTVQKVVALTLDKSRYGVVYAKTRTEAMKHVADAPPELILVSDQVADINVASFPKEVETWLARKAPTPPMVLITSQDMREMRHYAGVLKKPFPPQALAAIVTELAAASPDPLPGGEEGASAADDLEEQRSHKIFNDTFADEAKLVRETFSALGAVEEESRAPIAESRGAHESTGTGDLWADQPGVTGRPSAPPAAASAARSDLWGPQTAAPAKQAKQSTELLGAADSMAYKAVLEHQVQEKVESDQFEAAVERILERMLPGIVEKMVQERLDRLLKEQEEFLELKA